MRAVRVWFKKYGRAKFISHLDVNRLMTRAVRRAGLPIWYTEGFNPHPHLSFPLPLSLGQESECEPMDIKIEGSVGNDEIRERLNAVLPEGITIAEVAEPFCDIHEIAFAAYELSAQLDSEERAASVAEGFEKAVASGELIAEKMGKKGRNKVVKQINLCENIRSFSVHTDGCKTFADVVLPAGEFSNINPSLLVGVLCNRCGDDNLTISIKRTALLTKDGQIFR